MPRDFKTLAEQYADSCVHFTGIQNTQCKAGVAYDSFPRGTFPCLAHIGKGPKSDCASLHFPTPEEVAGLVEASELRYKRYEKAITAVQKDAKARGLRKGNGGQASVVCPVCTTGSLSYSVAGCNGHIHGRCDTKNCVWWMQ